MTFASLSPELERGRWLSFDCPKCGPSHRIKIPVAEVAIAHLWKLTGDTLENATVHPSVRCTTGCLWHGTITAGVVATDPS